MAHDGWDDKSKTTKAQEQIKTRRVGKSEVKAGCERKVEQGAKRKAKAMMKSNGYQRNRTEVWHQAPAECAKGREMRPGAHPRTCRKAALRSREGVMKKR